MDDTRFSSPLPRLSHALLLIGLLTVGAACVAPRSTIIPPPSKERFSEISKGLGQLRGLVAKRDFELTAPTTGNFQIGEHAAYAGSGDDALLAQLERAYKQLGLLGAKDDLKVELARFHRLDRLIAYDNGKDRLAIAADASRFGNQLQPPYDRIATELPLALGVVLALQEQHFQWQEKVDRTFIDDARLTYRAIARGDALLTALAYLTKDKLGTPGHLGAAWQISRQMETLARALPPFLRDQLLLPFREGSEFVAWAAQAKGSAGLNTLYADPPYTTAQLLHPQNYFLRRQPPRRFHPAGLLRYMEEPTLFEQSLGEFLLRGLLATEHPMAAARAIAAGWRGDQLFSFANKGFQTTAWYTSWSSADQAAAFQHAMQTVVDKRQRVRLRANAGAGDTVVAAHSRDQGSFALAREDDTVVYLVSRTERFAPTMAAAWQDLAVDNEPEILRFDSARGPAQLSLSKR